MGRIIFSIISLVVLAVVMVMNAGTTTGFNLFGWQVENVPVVVIAMLAFVAGALYSLVLYVSSYLARTRREKLAMQKERLKSQEQSMKSKDETLKAREKQMEALASAASQAPRRLPDTGDQQQAGARRVGSGRAGGSGTSARKRRGGWLRSLFGGKSASGR
ncbi:MAG: lipopolysaccharide assembly protein LapA domain-containing protein [Spirochaetota bacterium]